MRHASRRASRVRRQSRKSEVNVVDHPLATAWGCGLGSVHVGTPLTDVEMVAFLGSEDPEAQDDVGYEAAERRPLWLRFGQW